MSDFNIVLPSKPRVVSEEGMTGVYEIDGLYPGYGHTLGNSLRRIVLSSLPGAAVTLVKIDGAQHEFSTIEGVKEDVVTILLNLKRVRFSLLTDEPQTMTLSVKGVKNITAKDIDINGQVEVLNLEQPIATLTTTKAELVMEFQIQKGLGYVAKENLPGMKEEVGVIVLDAIFTPIKRVSYEVENMRVNDRTDFNKLKITIQTDGTMKPREALEKSIEIMVLQLKAIIGFQEPKEEVVKLEEEEKEEEVEEDTGSKSEISSEHLKTRIDTLDFSTRTANTLEIAKIRTIGGLVKKNVSELLLLDGLGRKGVEEIRKVLKGFDIKLED